MKLDSKRGQLTLFIILGVIFVVGIVGYFAVSRGVFDFSNSAARKFPELNSLVESCLEEATLDGIYFNSLQGGYYDVSEPKLEIEFLEVPLYFDKGNVVNVPNQDVLESELEKSIEDVIGNCFDVEDLSERGYEVELSDSYEVQVNVNANNVDVDVKTSVVVSQGESSASFSKFSKRVDFDYFGKVNVLEEFLEMQKENPESVLLTQMEEFAEEKSLEIEAFAFEDEGTDYMYNFLFNDKFGELEYLFSFGVRY